MKSVFVLLLAAAVAPALVQACDTLKACYLRNLKTGNETKLTGYNAYRVDPPQNQDYSIRCVVNGTATLNFIKFIWPTKTNDEFGEPRWMDQDNNFGEYVNPVEYLKSMPYLDQHVL
jgi:hypothetical protein